MSTNPTIHTRPVADVAYELHDDALDGGYTVERSEIVGRFETREEARQWMRTVAVMRESAARLGPLARRAVTESGASGDEARRELRESINWIARSTA